MVVPCGLAASVMLLISPPSLIARVPVSSWMLRVVIVNLDTAAMEASASPRKPSVCRANRSSDFVILLVA